MLSENDVDDGDAQADDAELPCDESAISTGSCLCLIARMSGFYI